MPPRNTIAIRPRGVDKTELEWIHLDFDSEKIDTLLAIAL